MKKSFKLGLVLGRFNHLHKGHIEVINIGLHNCEKVLLLVSSSQESMTKENPFNLKTRMDIIRMSFADKIEDGSLLLGHIDDINEEHGVTWSEYLLKKINMWTQHYAIDGNVDAVIFGKGSKISKWLHLDDSSEISEIKVSFKEDVSEEIVRESLLSDNFYEWNRCVPEEIEGRVWFDALRKDLLEIPLYKRI